MVLKPDVIGVNFWLLLLFQRK